MVLSIDAAIHDRGVKTGIELAQRTFEMGIEHGMRLLLQQQLEQRFKPLSKTAGARLHTWPFDRLLQLGENLLTAKSLTELGLEDAGNGTAPSP